MGILDVVDVDDLNLKLEAFGKEICLAVFEINDWNKTAIRVEIDRLKEVTSSISMLAVVWKDTAEVVTYVMNTGIRDVLLLPKNRERYKQIVEEKLAPYYEKLNPPESAKKEEPRFNLEIMENPGVMEALNRELKYAQRGNYPLSLVMAHYNGDGEDVVKGLIDKVKTFLRDTDKVLRVDMETFIGVFPFTEKDFVPILEEKFREAFKLELGRPGNYRKLYLYSATYPHDETSLDLLLERLENGINNSMVISTIRSPLNALSRTEIENYKQKIRQYKRFF